MVTTNGKKERIWHDPPMLGDIESQYDATVRLPAEELEAITFLKKCGYLILSGQNVMRLRNVLIVFYLFTLALTFCAGIAICILVKG